MPTASHDQQLELPYALLDVQGRTTLTVREVAQRLGCTPQHICELISSQMIGAINIGTGKRRMAARIPVECFRDFVIRSMTCPWERSPLRTLPLQALINHHRELGIYLRSKGVLRS
jgi:excisionase family DNA binding protein